MTNDAHVEQAFSLARERFAALGVDVDKALAALKNVPISLHCWQGDDVGGFENDEGLTGGGIQATGNYPGKARTPDELRSDFLCALRMIPGRHRMNLHASYAETGGLAVERDELLPEHFSGWIHWAKENGLGLDFNPTFFSHPLANGGFTLATRIRTFASFGFATASRAGISAKRWVARWTRRASRTSGFPTVIKTCRSIAARRAN